MSSKQPTSIYLTDEDRKVVAQLQERTGLSRSSVFRYALHRMFKDDDGASSTQARLLEIAEEIRQIAS